MASYIPITGYSIVLFMNPLNFVAIILKVTLTNKKRLENKKNV